ncbi:hypothetical protein ACIP39_24930 [Streptomyces tibetensis]|uniref:hypothetical protein n=1 Tax=Streptomyces tibetensis TaxID=2382123 RepID=UPI003827DC64
MCPGRARAKGASRIIGTVGSPGQGAVADWGNDAVPHRHAAHARADRLDDAGDTAGRRGGQGGGTADGQSLALLRVPYGPCAPRRAPTLIDDEPHPAAARPGLQLIESVNDPLKGRLDLEQHGTENRSRATALLL